jgi:hypothetical protein
MVKFNKPQHGHNINGMNTSLFKPVQARKQLDGEQQRAELFWQEYNRKMREAREVRR